jgi:hypothetical protein
MTGTSRPILTLSGLVRPDEDKGLELAGYDVLLPCRRFRIDHKVAVLGRVSLTAEFLLRLLKSADGIDEADAAAFFGFSLRDMSFVLSEVEGLGYVERRDGRLWLTFSGMSLFLEGSDEPKIFDVESRRESVGFDLIALAYEQVRGLDEFSRSLPELPLLHPEHASAATSRVSSAFRRFYPEVVSRRERSADKTSLYSIDEVLPEDRFSSVVRFSVQSTGLRPWVGTANLEDWRSEVEQEDRSEIVDAVAAFVDGLHVPQRSDDRDAYEVLANLAPEFLKDFVRKDGLAVDRYYRDAFNRVGEVRSNRQTVALVGSPLTRENVRKIMDALGYGLRSQLLPTTVLWLTPIVRAWGATRTLPELLRSIAGRLVDKADGKRAQVETISLVSGRPDPHVRKAFDRVAAHESPLFPQALEILLIPGVLAVAVVHAPVGAKNGLPVPLGFISFDPRVIERASKFLEGSMHRYLKDEDLDQRIREQMAMVSDSKLTDEGAVT